MNEQTLLTLQQAAKYSGKSEKTLRRWISSGKLAARKVGDKPADPYQIDPKDLDTATNGYTAADWDEKQRITNLLMRIEVLEETQVQLQDQLRNQAQMIEELKRGSLASGSTMIVSASRREDIKQAEQGKTLQVELWLRVENNNKHVRGKTKARAEIERLVLSQYKMNKKWKDGSDYTLTIPYETDKDLEKTIYDMLQEADTLADLRYCFIEADVRALDGSGRHW
jgi:excisionase family DNA binding protein